MNLKFDIGKAIGYSSPSQIARVLTENWVKNNSYCPSCGELRVNEFENNRPVADFYCSICQEEFELKSKAGKLSNKINDGAYVTMINRITSDSSPNFFFLTYSKMELKVENFIIIPKHFFVPDIIIKRKPLPITARRAGWTGCNIDLQKIPTLGRIFLIQESKIISKNHVLDKWAKTRFLRNKSFEAKGWALDILNCIDKIPSKNFSLPEVYNFEKELKGKYPNNNFIKDKIRQQLQILRDKGVIEFVNKGVYRKII